MGQRRWMLTIGMGFLNLVAGPAAGQAPGVAQPPLLEESPKQSPQYLDEASGAAAVDAANAPVSVTVTSGPAVLQPSVMPPPAVAQPTSQAVATIVVNSERREPIPRRRAQRRRAGPDPDDDGGEPLLHGFRLGYVATLNYDKRSNDGDESPKEKLGLSSPHSFLIGYELTKRVRGGGWLNILVIANGTVVGLEQSKILPSANFLIGFELRESFQIGVGVNLTPVKHKPAHMILAAGWTAGSGELLLPFHVFLIPDVDGNHRIGVTVGVNWES